VAGIGSLTGSAAHQQPPPSWHSKAAPQRAHRSARACVSALAAMDAY